MTDEPKKAGRPRKEINWDQFEKLCELHCTQSEIASFFRVHADTLRDSATRHYTEDFSIVYKRHLENGKCSLRRDQRVLAKKSAAMCIWLGKQYLGQKDIPDQQASEQTLTQFNALMGQLLKLQTSPAASPAATTSGSDAVVPVSTTGVSTSHDKIISINSNAAAKS